HDAETDGAGTLDGEVLDTPARGDRRIRGCIHGRIYGCSGRTWRGAVTVLHGLVRRASAAGRTELLPGRANNALTTVLDVRSPKGDLAKVRREYLVVSRTVIADQCSSDRSCVRIGLRAERDLETNRALRRRRHHKQQNQTGRQYRRIYQR